MTTIRIVCTFDAAGTAETLLRLLLAEQYDVVVSIGRQSLADLARAREARDVVVLIWSQGAATTHYVNEWSVLIDPARLIEISRGLTLPRSGRRAPVIEFSTWRGERGGKAWSALSERLRAASGRQAPSRLPLRAAAGAMLGIAAAAGMLAIGVHDAPEALKTEPKLNQVAMLFETPLDETGGMGGVSYLQEPASLDLEPIRTGRIRMHAAAQHPLDAQAPSAPLSYEGAEFRDPTLLERLAALNPLARDVGDD